MNAPTTPRDATPKRPVAPACRLSVLLARDVPVAVVLRRGPSAWYHVILWDLATDRLEHGAWLKGRIYEDKCDLSPDGKLLLTFVQQGSRARTSYTNAWTAISRPPWLHALTLWPQGTTYGGGGRFTSSTSVVLRTCDLRPHERHPLGALAASSGNPPLQSSDVTVEGADWAGRGQDGRLLFAQDGRLFRRERERERERDVEIADLRDLEPRPTEAPAWAREPILTRAKNERPRRRR